MRSTVLLVAGVLGKLHCCMLLLPKYCALLWTQAWRTRGSRRTLWTSYGELVLELTLTRGSPAHVGTLEQARG